MKSSLHQQASLEEASLADVCASQACVATALGAAATVFHEGAEQDTGGARWVQGVPQDGEGEEAHALAADAATNQHLTLREDPRFSLFSRKTTIFEHASCPYAPVPELPEGLHTLRQLLGESMSTCTHRITGRLR